MHPPSQHAFHEKNDFQSHFNLSSITITLMACINIFITRVEFDSENMRKAPGNCDLNILKVLFDSRLNYSPVCQLCTFG